ncbi:MAG: type II toxin-antitoxin system RelE/ParE family toxin [Terriglobia bacterium]
MADLLISPQAEMDLDQIWLYIAKESQSIERAERFLDRFTTFFSRLARNPYLGRQRDDLRPGYRSFPLGDYVILYRLTGAEEIMVLRVVHGSRDLGGLFL